MNLRDSHGSGTQGLLHSPCVPSVPQMARTQRDKCPVCPACPADEGQEGHEGQLSGLSRLSRTYPNIEIEGVIVMPINPARQDMARKTDAARARELLASITPLKKWMVREKPSPERAHLALRVARETMRIAALTPAEEAAVAAKLQLAEAIALMEKSNVA